MTFETSTATPSAPASNKFLWGMGAEPGNAPEIYAQSDFLFKSGGHFLSGASFIGFGNGFATPLAPIHIWSPSPQLYMEENDQAADERIWRFASIGKTFGIQLVNDANNAAQTAYQINRGTGTAVNFHAWFSGGTERMRLDASGRLGIGTATPIAPVHISHGSPTLIIEETDQAADEKSWRMNSASKVFNFQAIDDVNVAAQTAWRVVRGTGVAIDSLDFFTGGTIRLHIDSSAIRAGIDNALSNGSAGQRFTVVYAATGAINTSDAREKLWLGGLTDAHLRTARRIEAEIGLYQWLKELSDKGEAARIHVGVRAQAVITIMMEEGLEAMQDIDLPADRFIPEGERPSFRHAFLCFDTWEEVREPIMEQRMVKKRVQIEEVVESQVLGPDSRPVRKPRKRWITREEMETVETGEFKVTPAGNRFGIRPDQLALFLAAAQGARIAEQDTRLAALEEQLAG